MAIEMLFRDRGPPPGTWEVENGPMGLFRVYLRLNFFWTVEKVDPKARVPAPRLTEREHAALLLLDLGWPEVSGAPVISTRVLRRAAQALG